MPNSTKMSQERNGAKRRNPITMIYGSEKKFAVRIVKRKFGNTPRANEKCVFWAQKPSMVILGWRQKSHKTLSRLVTFSISFATYSSFHVHDYDDDKHFRPGQERIVN